MPISRTPLAATLVVALTALASPALAAPSEQGAESRASFVITLRPGVSPEGVAREWKGKGVEVRHVYSHAMNGFSGRMGPELASTLGRDARVARIEKDALVRLSATQTSPTWGLDRIDQRALPLDRSFTHSNTGAGVSVYVLDTGVRASHVELAGRVAPGFDAMGGGSTDDCNGHGTHVAATAAGSVHGVAKQATVVPVRVLGCDGSGSYSGIIAGVDWVTAQHQAGAPAVANMSLGGSAYSTLDTAIRNSINDGVSYALAAGNSDVDACTTSPSRVAEGLTVGASTISDARAGLSNWGSCLDVFAPGSSITSASHTSDTGLTTMSGTSMAAPHVAGVAALVLAQKPSMLPAELNALLLGGATTNVVADPKGSPNRLLHSSLVVASEPTSPSPSPVVSAPAAPTNVVALARSKAADVSWTHGADGGSAITSSTVRVLSGTKLVKTVSVSGTASSVRVSGLKGGTSYRFTVSATNAVGTSPVSASSNTVTALR